MTLHGNSYLQVFGALLVSAALISSAQSVAAESKRIPPPLDPIEKAVRSLTDMPKHHERTLNLPRFELPDLVPVIITTDPCWIKLKISNVSNRGVPETQLEASRLWFEARYSDGRTVDDHRDLVDVSNYRNLLRGYSGTAAFTWPLLPGEEVVFTLDVDTNHAVPEVSEGNNRTETASSCPAK